MFNKNDFSPYLSNLFKIFPSGGFIEYEGEDELERIITELTDAAIEKVIPIFDVIVAPEEHISFQIPDELRSNIEIYAEKFMQKYNMVYTTETAKIKSIVKEIENLIDKKQK